MSRSHRKSPIVPVTNCRSERQDKKTWHQRWRARERTALSSANAEALAAHAPVPENLITNVWAMEKDGHQYWSQNRQKESASEWAKYKGQNPQERQALAKRLMHKLMAK